MARGGTQGGLNCLTHALPRCLPTPTEEADGNGYGVIAGRSGPSGPPSRASVNLVPLLLTGVRLHPPGRTDKNLCRCFGAPATHVRRPHGRVFPDHPDHTYMYNDDPLRQRRPHTRTSQVTVKILPQILGSLPEVIRSCCHHHHQRSSRGRFEWSARFHRPSRRVAGPGKRHSARGTPRAQPRDVRSAGRDTWNLTGEALGGPRKRSWRRCSRARSGRRSAIRGAHSGALDRPEPSDPAARAPIRTSAPYSAADASGSSCAAGARLR